MIYSEVEKDKQQLSFFCLEDTITAISTPPGESGIGVVRLSGKRALDIASKIFIRFNNASSLKIKPYRIYYGHIVNPINNQTIDEVILAYMKAPKSYTGEDVVEISCHGGLVPASQILELCLEGGARTAEPGEFTKRAFLNGRIDLAQAEAVIDVIKSRNDRSLKVAINQLRGHLSRKLLEIGNGLMDILAQVEASLDFPEEELELSDDEEIKTSLMVIDNELDILIKSFREGRIIREGLKVAIIGRTNVGKSSLMNRLLRCERSIVTCIPGTTRDTIEEDLVVDGLPIRLIDTAGLRDSNDVVENEGIKRARKALQEADVVLFVLDAREGLTKQDLEIAQDIKERPVIAVMNKIDLIPEEERAALVMVKDLFEEIPLSVKTGWGLEALKKKIVKCSLDAGFGEGEGVVITRARHSQSIKYARGCVENALLTIRSGLSREFVAVDLREALEQLGLITGQTYTEEVLDRVFSQFCIGK